VGPERRGGWRRWLTRLLLLTLLLGGLFVLADVALLSESVTRRMEGRPHTEPARITGVVPRLAPGEPATEQGWRRTLRAAGYQLVEGEPVAGQARVDGQRWIVHPREGEAVEVLVRQRRITEVRRAADGRTLPGLDVALPPVSLLTGQARERRTVVPLEAIPLSLQRAVVSIEDERFFQHGGLDPRGIARAAWRNVRAGGVSQGGSTLTQQLAKNMFLNADRSFARKFQEALIALILEARYAKPRLLEAYLNEIYLGQRGGFAILGVGEAARAWFGKDVGALSLSESALLAGAIHSPNRTVPWKHPDEAARRRDLVLDAMERLHAVPREQVARARLDTIDSSPRTGAMRRAPWFVDAIVAELGDRYSAEALHRDGLELVVTLDPRFQDAAERAVSDTLAALVAEHPELAAGGGPEAALLAMDPSDGAVRALVGGSDYGRSQFNRALYARRQPGSAFKPIVLASAIEARWPQLGPGTLVDDSPLAVAGAGPGGSTWRPKNYDDQNLGLIPLSRATELSRNLPFVRLGMDTGLDKVRDTATRLGVRTPLAAVASLSIGAQEVTPLDLVTAYATLANGGQRPTPRLLEGVRTADGAWLERALPASEPALPSRVAAVVTHLLEGVVDRGTGKGLRRAGITIPLAAKTGTSNDGRDAWVVAYSPDLVVAVWVGFDEDRTLGLGSGSTAVPVAARFLEAVEPWLSGKAFPDPRGVPMVEPAAEANAAPVTEAGRRRALRQEDAERRAAEREAMREARRARRGR
jgi:penicillin-binding protein 1B